MDKTVMEIWFDSFLLFPYKFLDYLTEEQWAPFKESAIYFVLKVDRKRIVDWGFEDGGIRIIYQNAKNKLYKSIGPFWFYDFIIPAGYVRVNVSSGSYLEVEITPEGLKYLEKNNPEALEHYNLSLSVKIALYDLIAANEQNCNTTESYSVQYIGQSMQIQDRLTRHEKIQKIIRDLDLMDSDSETMILLYHPKSKFHVGFDIPYYKSIIWTGNSEWKNYSHIATEIGDKELLDATEAMLIQYFNPQYNDNFKNTMPSNTQKTFKKLEQNYINELNIGLQLQLSGNTTMHLTTESISTNKRKMIILSCDLSALAKNKYSEIHVEEVNNWLFDIIN